MHEHFSHLLISAIPFVAITLLLLWRNRSFGFVRSGVLIILLLVVTLQAIPVHYMHAAHAQDLQTYQCCIPGPVALTAFFAIDVPQEFPVVSYLLASSKAEYSAVLTFQSRAPPLG